MLEETARWGGGRRRAAPEVVAEEGAVSPHQPERPAEYLRRIFGSCADPVGFPQWTGSPRDAASEEFRVRLPSESAQLGKETKSTMLSWGRLV